MSESDGLRERLERLVLREVPDASELRIEALHTLSGGNARRAWSFNVSFRAADRRVEHECVVLLRTEAGQLERDLGAEFQTLAALAGSGVPAPRALWCDLDGSVLGHPGFVMERVSGSARLGSLLNPEERVRNHALAEAMAKAAAELHRLDWRARGLGGGGEPNESNVAGVELDAWEALFVAHRMEPLPALSGAFAWLRANAPRAGRVALVHGDFRFGNIVYEGAELRALLDWEMAHLGDPCEDLAWAYRSLWGPQEALPFEDFVACYHAAGGPPAAAQNLHFYRLFGEVKHAVISLTGADAFASGRSRNLRLADRMSWVPECLERFYAGSEAGAVGS